MREIDFWLLEFPFSGAVAAGGLAARTSPAFREVKGYSIYSHCSAAAWRPRRQGRRHNYMAQSANYLSLGNEVTAAPLRGGVFCLLFFADEEK
jgi:hypothetical protein